MEDFQFQSPLYLLLLVALPFIQGAILHLQKRGKDRLLLFLAPKNLKELERERWVGGTRRKFILFWVGLAFFALALARPQANPIIEDVQGASLDIYVLLDVSKSMDAEDVPPSRLKKAKRTVEGLLSSLSGDRLGIIAFAGTSVMISPLTADYDVLKLFLSNVDTSIIQNQGTNIAGALQTAYAAMKRGAEKFGSESRSNVFLVLSDGEDTAAGNYEIAEQIKNSGGIIFSIAFGTEAGASIPVRNARGELSGYKRDRRGNQVVTKVEPGSMRTFAESSGGNFYFSTPEETEIKDILQRLQGLERGSAAVRRAKLYQEYFIYPLAFGLFCIMFSFFSARVIFSLSLWKGIFRKTALIFVGFTPLLHAAPLEFLYDSEKRAYLRSEKLLQEGKPEEAAQQMKELLADNPDDESVSLNLGIYNAQSKKVEEANLQFERIIRENKKLVDEALFNSAGNFAANGKVNEARGRYADLLSKLENKKEPTARDQELIELVRKNLAKLSSNPPPQNQQNSGSGKNGDSEKKNDEKSKDQNDKESQEDSKKDSKNNPQNKKDGEDPNSENPENPQEGDGKDPKDEENKDGESGEEKKNLPMAGGNPNKQKYLKKNNMEEQDAKRILEALKQRESGIQKKFMKFDGKGNEDLRDNNEKDW